jgi:hypothetical protein
MSDSVIKLAEQEIVKIEEKMKSLSSEIDKLRKLYEAWAVIRDSSDEDQLELSLMDAIRRREETTEDKLEATAAYGDKTNSLRKSIAQSGAAGLSRFQIITLAKNLGAHPNFPYRFISRMLQAGELHESNERFIATNKMIEKIKNNVN